MNKFTSFIKKLFGYSFSITAISSLVIYLGHMTGIVDAQPILDWLTVKKETLLSLGISGTAITVFGVGYRFLSIFIAENTSKIRQEFTQINQNVLDRMSTVEEKENENNTVLNKVANSNMINTEILMMILEFNLILASNKLDSKIYNESDKLLIKTWMENIKTKSGELSRLLLELKNSNLSNIGEVNTFIEQSNNIIETVNNTLEMAKGYL